MKNHRHHAAFAGVALLAGWLMLPGLGQDPAQQAELLPPKLPDSSYVGAAKCKNCHKSEAAGEVYGKWEAHKHAKTFEVLKGDKAKEVAAARGIADPSKAPECLKCHVTAFGEDEKKIKSSFKAELGVQCESCHGPGDDHVKTRMKAAALAGDQEMPWQESLPAEEIILPNEATCRKCHNPESPTYQEFDFSKRLEEIRHLHPQRAKPRVVAKTAAEPAGGASGG